MSTDQQPEEPMREETHAAEAQPTQVPAEAAGAPDVEAAARSAEREVATPDSEADAPPPQPPTVAPGFDAAPATGAPGAGAPPPPPSGAPGAGAPPPPPPSGGPGFGAVPPPIVGPEPPAPQPGVRYNVAQDQKNLALISTLGILIVGFLSPLIVYVLTSSDPAKRFANDHAKEGLNFSIVFFAGWVIAFLLAFVIIGFLLMPFLAIWGLWVIIAGAIQANNGEAPHYPLVPKLLK